MPDEKKLLILFLEDSDDDFSLLTRHVKKHGLAFKAIRVDSLDAFKDQIKFNPPDLVISDYNLQTGSGLDALRELRVYNKDIPFIVVSGYIGEEAAVSLLKSGASDYVGKENLNKLGVAIDRVVAEMQLKADKKLYEERLKEELERNRKLVSSMSEGLVLLDERFQIIFSNQSFQKMMGYTEEELANKKWVSLLKEVNEFIPLTTAKETNRETVLITKDNKELWVNISKSSIDEKNKRRTIKVISDLTYTRQNESRLQELNYEMEQLIYRASHDLRGPISSMEGLIESINLMDLDPEIYRAFKVMTEEAYQILDSLALVTKFQHSAVNQETILLNPLLVQLCQSELKSITHNVKLQLKTKDLYTDKAAFVTIVKVLLDNVVKHSQNTEPDPVEVVISTEEDESNVYFKVKDNGPGIAPRHQQQIFDMFYRANPGIRSTGLGLYLSKKIAKRLGGSLYLEQSTSKGSTFVLQLPNSLNTL